MEDQKRLPIFNKTSPIYAECLRKMEKGITPAKPDCFVLLRAEQHFHIPLADLMKIDLEVDASAAVFP